MFNNWYDSVLTLDDKKNNKSTEQYRKVKSEDGRFPVKRNRKENSWNRKFRGKSIKTIDESDGYDEDDEDDDERLDNASTSEFGVKVPRVQTSDDPTTCNCFPKRSSKHISSMLYENLECKHTGLKGETHPGVYKFNHNWNCDLEEPEPISTKHPKNKNILRHIKPKVSDEKGKTDNEDSDEKGKTDNKPSKKENTKKTETKSNKKLNESKRSLSQESTNLKFPYGLLDFMLEEEDQTPLEEGGITLPRIGYTPPPSRERLSSRSIPQSLPPLPESPFMCNNGQETSRSEDQNTKEIDLSGRQYRKDKYKTVDRRFKGHYFDPVLKRSRSYEIMPKFRKGLNEWHAYMDDKNKQNSMTRALNGRRTTNGNLYLHDNTVVMEDDEYDDDYEDYVSDKDAYDKSKKK